jgi:hypothetical protein
MKSEVADIKYRTAGLAGFLLGGVLKKIRGKYPWVHLDLSTPQ